MSLYGYVYVDICIWICVCGYVYVDLCMWICVYGYVYVDMSMQRCMHADVCTCGRVCCICSVYTESTLND